ncbi:MAG: MerR family transcriptional regulator [Lachnospiraceae bacterium]|nr:MerR family transcriptional regulator [Lachnospiraceae bacterium]
MYRIGEFSKMSKMTIKALRYYDEIGLLKPKTTDEITGYRFYTTDQLIRVHKIQSLRQVGLSIDEITLIMSGHEAVTILEKRRVEILSELEEHRSQLSKIEFILQGKEEEYFMNYVATVKELPECIVYSKKMTVPNYDAYFEILPALGAKVMEKYPDLKCVVPEYCFIIYHDGEYKEKDINVEYCEAVNKMKPDFDGIIFKKMASVTAVSVMHKGSYANLPQAYAFAFKWIEENDYILADAPRESYIDGIWNKENEEEWLTELQLPIVKKK